MAGLVREVDRCVLCRDAEGGPARGYAAYNFGSGARVYQKQNGGGWGVGCHQ